jgi:hypothetical protein
MNSLAAPSAVEKVYLPQAEGLSVFMMILTFPRLVQPSLQAPLSLFVAFASFCSTHVRTA